MRSPGAGSRPARTSHGSPPGPRTSRPPSIDGIRVLRAGGELSLYPRAAARLLRTRADVDVVVDCQNGIPFFSPLFARGLPVVQVYTTCTRTSSTRGSPARCGAGPVPRGPARDGSTGRGPWSRCPLDPPGAAAPPALRLPDLRGPQRYDHHSRPTGPRAPTRPYVVSAGWCRTSGSTCCCATSAAARRVPQLRVDIVGDGPERARLRRSSPTSAAATVTFHGCQPDGERDAPAEPGLADRGTSAAEGWGWSVIEAAAWGCPAWRCAPRASRLGRRRPHRVAGRARRRFGPRWSTRWPRSPTDRAAGAAADCRPGPAASPGTAAPSCSPASVLGQAGRAAGPRARRPPLRPRDMTTVATFPSRPPRPAAGLRLTDEVAEDGGTTALLPRLRRLRRVRLLRRLGIADADIRLAERTDLLPARRPPPLAWHRRTAPPCSWPRAEPGPPADHPALRETAGEPRSAARPSSCSRCRRPSSAPATAARSCSPTCSRPRSSAARRAVPHGRDRSRRRSSRCRSPTRPAATSRRARAARGRDVRGGGVAGDRLAAAAVWAGRPRLRRAGVASRWPSSWPRARIAPVWGVLQGEARFPRYASLTVAEVASGCCSRSVRWGWARAPRARWGGSPPARWWCSRGPGGPVRCGFRWRRALAERARWRDVGTSPPCRWSSPAWPWPTWWWRPGRRPRGRGRLPGRRHAREGPDLPRRRLRAGQLPAAAGGRTGPAEILREALRSSAARPAARCRRRHASSGARHARAARGVPALAGPLPWLAAAGSGWPRPPCWPCCCWLQDGGARRGLLAVAALAAGLAVGRPRRSGLARARRRVGGCGRWRDPRRTARPSSPGIRPRHGDGHRGGWARPRRARGGPAGWGCCGS